MSLRITTCARPGCSSRAAFTLIIGELATQVCGTHVASQARVALETVNAGARTARPVEVWLLGTSPDEVKSQDRWLREFHANLDARLDGTVEDEEVAR